MRRSWMALLLGPTVLAVVAGACSGASDKPATAARPTDSSPPAPQAAAVAFDTTVSLLGVTFRVAATTTGSAGRLTITPSGLEIDNSAQTDDIDGTVTGVEVADLNVDRSPEVYVYVTSAGSGSYGSLVAYAANRNKSLSRIYLPPITEQPKASQGYQGHDEYSVVENTLVRRFPVYRETDTNDAPTGGTRQVQYKLRQGEAGWVLKSDKVVAY